MVPPWLGALWCLRETEVVVCTGDPYCLNHMFLTNTCHQNGLLANTEGANTVCGSANLVLLVGRSPTKPLWMPWCQRLDGGAEATLTTAAVAISVTDEIVLVGLRCSSIASRTYGPHVVPTRGRLSTFPFSWNRV